MPCLDCSPAIADLEARLYDYLGIPLPPPGSAPVQTPAGPLPARMTAVLRELRREVFELQQESARIGKLPDRYPRHIVLIMKTISALLPWYTRPIAHFSQRAARTADAIARLLDEMLRNQEALAADIAALKQAASMPALPNASTPAHSGNHQHLGRSAKA